MSAVTSQRGERIRQLHLEAHSLADQAIERALEAGRFLVEVKRDLAHGEFGPWVEKHCGFTDRTARRYMRLHLHRDSLPANTGINSALEHIKTDTVSVFDIDAGEEQDNIRMVRRLLRKMIRCDVMSNRELLDALACVEISADAVRIAGLTLKHGAQAMEAV